MGKQGGAPPSRSIYPRNAKSKSGYMNDPSKNATSRSNLKNINKSDRNKSISGGRKEDVMMLLDHEKALKIDNSSETRFTLPSSPNNVNVVVETARRQAAAHDKVIRNLNNKNGIMDTRSEMELL